MIIRLLLGIAIIAIAVLPVRADQMAPCRKNASLEKQIEACLGIINQNPGTDILANAWTYRGNAYARKGSVQAAIENFSQAIRLKPAHAAAWIGRGHARLVARQFSEAIEDFAAAIRLRPRDGSVYVARGYALIVSNKHQEAIVDFTKAIAISPSNAVAFNNRGLAYSKLGQYDRAADDFTQAIRKSPLYALAHNNRGYVHEALGKKSKAIDDFRNALAIDPSLVGARDALVRLSAASDLAEQSTKRVAAGQAIAQQSCAWCHAVGARGESPNKDAPAFRDIHRRHPVLNLRQPISRAIVEPHDNMPRLLLSDAEIDQIIAYINSLRRK